MQQIERYGVIALVFLLVTIVAVSFWGDNKAPGFWSRLTGSKPVVAENKDMVPPPSNGELTHESNLAIGGDGQAPSTLPQVGGELVQGQPEQAAPVNQQPAPSAETAQVMPPPATVPAPNLEPKTAASKYVVKSGDSLARIAKRQLGAESRWEEIVALNPGVNAKNLKVGQELTLPAGAAPMTAEAKPNPKPAPSTTPVAKNEKPAPKSSAKSYTVRKGDTLSAIARRELGSAARAKDIQALNPGLDPAKLKVGQTIQMPGGNAAVAANLEPKRRVQ